VNSFLGLKIETLSDGRMKFSQPKLIDKILKTYSIKSMSEKKFKLHSDPYGPVKQVKENDCVEDMKPIKQSEYLKLLGSLVCLVKLRPDLRAVCSFAATKNKNPTQGDFVDLLHIIDYIRETREKGLVLNVKESDDDEFSLYCEVDASYRVYPGSKGYTGYCIGYFRTGFFHFKSIKQPLVSTSSTHSEVRAIFTLTKDLIFCIDLCQELRINLKLPALLMKDNSAVLTVAMDETSMRKKGKHFMMLINYVRKQNKLNYIKVLMVTQRMVPRGNELWMHPIFLFLRQF